MDGRADVGEHALVDETVAAPEGVAELRVLAAEDNATNQLVLKTLLGELGISVTLVGDGAQAVQAWRDAEFDLVLMDMQMPVMDGLTATRQIRAAEVELSRHPTPIIALTADVMVHHVKGYEAAGISGVVAKPLQFNVLLSVMSDVLGAGDAEELGKAA